MAAGLGILVLVFLLAILGAVVVGVVLLAQSTNRRDSPPPGDPDG